MPVNSDSSPAAIPPLLTQREMMIIFLMSAGHTASEIAKLLDLRPRTVENRKRSIYEKLGVGSQSHAVAKAIWLGLLQPGPPAALPRTGPAPQRQAGEPGRALLAVLVGPAGQNRDGIGQLLVSERVPFVLVARREELIRDHWLWWQRGPIVVVLTDPGPEDWDVTIALGAPVVLIRSSDIPAQPAIADGLARQASAVVSKADATAGLTPVLAAVAQGLVVMSWADASALLNGASAAAPSMPKLTPREFDILGSIARGHTIRQTARALGIAAKTVENTQARLFRKLGVRNRTAALTTADAMGLLDRGIVPADQTLPGGSAARSSPGYGKPLFDSAGAGHEQDRCDARPWKTQPGIDVRIPVRGSRKVTRADIRDDGGAVRADSETTHRRPEGGKRIRPPQGARDGGVACENHPAYPHLEMIIAAE
ncbi:MAG TPA: LuxR C-terminal-related transcriptional regulator [Streptosporangiaceae bacterium]|jgi:DNA-binding NarL/FixJ family response regulator